jgi:hypothetical protein
MTPGWYEPDGCRERLKRILSFLNIGVMIISAVLVFSEFRFDWGEQLLGEFLAAINHTRPEKGVVWELGQDMLTAHETVSRLIDRKSDTKAFADRTDSFDGIARRLLPGEWVTLDKAHFKDLYQSLPLTHARQILEPARLIWLLNGDITDRIFCEGLKNGMKIYFIDTGNRVIHQVELTQQTLTAIAEKKYLEPGTLDAFEAFSGRIYPVDRFFGAVFKLPAEMIPDLLPDTDLLLDQEGVISRVGIWNEAENGFIRLGFEFRHQGQVRVLFVNAREWAVWQLGLILKGAHS